MMQPILAWLLIAAVIIAAYPWAVALTAIALTPSPPPGRRGEQAQAKYTDDSATSSSELRWLAWCVALALAVGALTLIMFWESLLGVRLSVGTVMLPYALLALVGRWVNTLKRDSPAATGPRRIRKMRLASPSAQRYKDAHSGRSDVSFSSEQKSRHTSDGASLPERLATIALVGIAAAVLFNAAYWPFSREDAIGIYDAQAKQIAATGALLPLTGGDSLYLTYPALMPLAYAYSYIASGWHNEYLARVIAALLALGCLPATWLLGRAVGGRFVGWLSVFIFALAPTFVKWASAGYVDLPMAFYYTLAALFAWRLAQSDDWKDALLSGLMLGLAAWTKNAALIGVPLLGGWLLLLLAARRIGRRQVVMAGMACALVAAPWYVRNWIGAGFLIPATAWTERAGHTVANLLVFVLKPENFALSGWLIVIGVGAGLVTLARRRALLSAEAFLLWWTIPFFAAWWLFVSYDPRFLLLFLPPLSVLAGLTAARLRLQVPAHWSARLTWPIVIVVVVAALALMVVAVEFKRDLVRAPLMDDAAKHTVVQQK